MSAQTPQIVFHLQGPQWDTEEANLEKEMWGTVGAPITVAYGKRRAESLRTTSQQPSSAMSAPHLLLAHPPTSSVHVLKLPTLALHTSASVGVPPHALSLAGNPPMLFAAQVARPTIAAFRLTQQNSLTEITKHPAPERISALDESPRGSFLVAGSPSGRLYIWEVPTGELVRQWEGHYKKVGVVRFSPSGDIVWTGGDDGAVHGWLIAECVFSGPRMVPKRPKIDHSIRYSALPIGLLTHLPSRSSRFRTTRSR